MRASSAVAGVQKMRPRKPCADEPRQVAAVIEVRVRQHDGVDVGRANRQRLPVALAQLLESLEQAAVDEHACAPPTSSRCFEPVTVRAAPRNVSVKTVIREESSSIALLSASVPEEHVSGPA